MQYTFLFMVATEPTDGSDLNKLKSVYRVVDDYDRYFDHVLIPATTLPENIETAILSALPPVPANKVAALSTMQAIPDWAHWNIADANAWGQTNIGQPLEDARTDLAALATLNLATFKTVIGRLLDILDAMWTLQKALSQMVIALRNNTWPQLES